MSEHHFWLADDQFNRLKPLFSTRCAAAQLRLGEPSVVFAYG